MTDQWEEHLRCPECRHIGTVSLSQFEQALIPTVIFVTAGFAAVQTEFGPTFHFGACNVPAEP